MSIKKLIMIYKNNLLLNNCTAHNNIFLEMLLLIWTIYCMYKRTIIYIYFRTIDYISIIKIFIFDHKVFNLD